MRHLVKILHQMLLTLLISEPSIACLIFSQCFLFKIFISIFPLYIFFSQKSSLTESWLSDSTLIFWFYFNRITLMWNSLPKNIKDSDTISSFKSKLKSFYFTRLLNAFDGDNFHSFKLICPKCCRVNTSSVCTCS